MDMKTRLTIDTYGNLLNLATHYSISEGEDWLPASQMPFTGALEIHSLMFSDGSQWDIYNGWRLQGRATESCEPLIRYEQFVMEKQRKEQEDGNESNVSTEDDERGAVPPVAS